MSRSKIDQLDLNILRDLSRNARKPFLEIARECGVSGAAIHQRIQRLQNTGIIKGSEYQIDPDALGYETCAFVGLYMSDPSQYQSVVEALERMPEVVECHYTTGQYDILVKLYARNNDDLLHIVQRIQALGMSRTETLISFKEIFRRQMFIE